MFAPILSFLFPRASPVPGNWTLKPSPPPPSSARLPLPPRSVLIFDFLDPPSLFSHECFWHKWEDPGGEGLKAVRNCKVAPKGENPSASLSKQILPGCTRNTYGKEMASFGQDCTCCETKHVKKNPIFFARSKVGHALAPPSPDDMKRNALPCILLKRRRRPLSPEEAL